MKSHAIITAFAGLILAGVGLTGLTRSQEDALRHDRNPFALYGSGYGKLLARLSQDTVDKVWHLGVEQVNPEDHHHDHGESDHEHSHSDHQHEHAGDDHGHEYAHQDHDQDHDDHGHAHGEHGHAEPGHGDGHAHDDHAHGNEPERESLAAHQPGLIETARDWLSDLKNTRYERTNPKGMSRAHQLTVTRDIENMLLRGYRMDPTDYGVYNGYFLFLTIHELRATPRARDHARTVSRNTIAVASREDTDPSPWMTATMAVLNLFFLDLEDYRAKDEPAPVEMVRGYRQQMNHCLRQFAVLKQKAVHENRWERIPPEQREAMQERERFALKAFEQFDAMLARHEATSKGKERAETEPSAVESPVAENARTEEAG